MGGGEAVSLELIHGEWPKQRGTPWTFQAKTGCLITGLSGNSYLGTQHPFWPDRFCLGQIDSFDVRSEQPLAAETDELGRYLL